MRTRLSGFRMLRLAGVLAAAGFLTGVANAQSAGRFKGSFTLPCQTRWENAALPAGDYLITVPSVSKDSYMRVDSVNGKSHAFVSQWITGDKLSDRNIIVLAVNGSHCEVRAVNLADLDMVVSYKPLSKRQMVLLRRGRSGQLVALAVKKH